MSSCHCPCKDDIRQMAFGLGASACGFARAECVDGRDIALYDKWIADGMHGTMDYCARYRDQRYDPRLLLDGAQTVISCAFSYNNPDRQSLVSKYAWGDDYHWVIKSRLAELAAGITAMYGGECRALVDTAPLRERYWAQRCGIGFRGINGLLIVPGIGSYVFLGTLLWTGDVVPDTACDMSCEGCMACVRACPGAALDGSGVCDARRCRSYITIEYRGELDPQLSLPDTIYGCDVCQRVCPHNAGAPVTAIDEFTPNESIVSLSADEIGSMTSSGYKRLTARSAMRRVTLRQLQRNLRAH